MPYTTQGFMTYADIAEVRRDMDLDLCSCCEDDQAAREFGGDDGDLCLVCDHDADDHLDPAARDEAPATTTLTPETDAAALLGRTFTAVMENGIAVTGSWAEVSHMNLPADRLHGIGGVFHPVDGGATGLFLPYATVLRFAEA